MTGAQLPGELGLQRTDTMTSEEQAFMERFIEGRRWIWAKTYATTAPHWYTLRKEPAPDEGEGDLDRFVVLLREHGYDRLYYGKTFRSIVIGEHYYWTMGAPLPETILVNRALKDT
jgi:hypothetical protein